ncbi:ProQ/FINO family protein [Halomonas pacifica]|uniref:ProQ/FINO family protein n=1 Tax=Bisbaumannia pacifica TaxID=77098 RepID=UPI002359413D|nr:ProQ/FINO family protein [Halomonas pacifica]MDC8803602.1 ProQ/FINO family protein [Halomonas pacifica]
MSSEANRHLLAALEGQIERRLDELSEARRRVAELEARNRRLEADNLALRRRLEAEHPETSVPRSQGLAALIGRRPRGQEAAAGGEPSASQESLPAQESPASREPLFSQVSRSLQESPLASQESSSPQESPLASQESLSSQESPSPQESLPIDAPPSPQALLAQWYRRYPQAFFKGHTRPLKVGIHEELLVREPWPEKLVRRALACYVHLPRYLKAVRAGAQRVGLDGERAGEVTEGEARYAHRQLEAFHKERRGRGKPATGKSTTSKASPKAAKASCQAAPSGGRQGQGDDGGRPRPLVAEQTDPQARLASKLDALLAKHNR